MTFSFYWHDYETSGTNPRLDRPTQFAGIRTDAELNPVGDPQMWYCQPVTDVLPHPRACLITGISPQLARDQGVAEPEFIARILGELGRPGTCGLGYNSLRFDDEITRHTAWRNFFPPYEREYKNGCSRWDLIDVVRLCYALRPDGIEWPRRDDGAPSFRLEDLARANHLKQARAHDALSDVEATIDLARLIRRHQPRLWEFALTERTKARVQDRLDLVHHTPVVHVSQRIPARWGCLSLIMPIARHPSNPNQVLSYDLRHDPADLLELAVDEIQDRLFTPNNDLPDGVERVALKGIQVNRCPILAPLNTLTPERAAALELDVDQCLAHARRIQARLGEVIAKVEQVYSSADFEPSGDPEQNLYGGSFPSPRDARLCQDVRALSAAQFTDLDLRFDDSRYSELLFRYRGRHYPDSMNAAERDDWNRWVARRLEYAPDGGLSLGQYRMEVAELLRTETGAEAQAILLKLQAWGDEIEQECGR